MTKLSLFLYAADALDSIGEFCVAFGVIAAIIFVIFVCIATIDDDYINEWCKVHTKRILIIPIVVMFVCFGTAAIIPEKKTMYMIAGIELADMFRQTDTAKELSSEMKGVLTDITDIIHSYANEHGANAQKEAK